MKQCQLRDPLTHFKVQRIFATKPSPSPSIISKDSNNQYLSLLSDYPALTQVYSPETPIKHNINHHIEVICCPNAASPRHLAPEQLRATKLEFEHMLLLGIVQCLVITATLGAQENIRLLETMQRPPHSESVHCSKPLPSPIHSRFLLLTLRHYNLQTYHEIPVASDNVPKTALTTSFGLFEFVRLPFGLRNAAQMFQNFIDEVLRGTTSAYAYIDDVLIASPTPEQHLQDV